MSDKEVQENQPPTKETKKRPFEPTEPGQAWRGHHENKQIMATVEYDKAGKKLKAEEKFKDVQVPLAILFCWSQFDPPVICRPS